MWNKHSLQHPSLRHKTFFQGGTNILCSILPSDTKHFFQGGTNILCSILPSDTKHFFQGGTNILCSILPSDTKPMFFSLSPNKMIIFVSKYINVCTLHRLNNF